MTYTNRKGSRPLIDKYPYSIILTRWILTAVEMGLATFFVIRFRFELGVAFLAYGVVCVFLLLPVIRCVRCYYYGKRCNFGWGVMVSKLFPRVEGESHASMYGFTILFWPLRILPVGVGLLGIYGGILGEFKMIPQGLFAIYLLVILVHRWFYRSLACTRCHQREGCPVYDISAIRGNDIEGEAVVQDGDQ
jgi:hypothetical protein